MVDLPYRFSSWVFDYPDNIQVWCNSDGQLLAWAVMQTPFWAIDYAYCPDTGHTLHRKILEWAGGRAYEIVDSPSGHPAWYIDVFPDQTNRIRDLEEVGFTSQANIGDDSWSKVFMRRSSQTSVKVYDPPSGFIVRSLAGEKDVQNNVELHQSVFESKNMTTDWRIRTLQHPDYKPDLDIVVESPDNHLVAFCICWFDDFTNTENVETLGSHKDFRRYGLGWVALSEVLRRLQSLGAQNIFVEIDNYRNAAFRLYQSFDFE